MLALTPSERRGALVLVLLLLIGAGHDLWKAGRGRPPSSRSPQAIGSAPAADDLDGHLELPSGGALDARAGASATDPGVAGPSTTPAAGVGGPWTAPGGMPGTTLRRQAPLDLNRADARELDALPGVGPVLAGRIVLQRRHYGPFLALEDLLGVRGVGPRLLERIRPWVTVGPARRAGSDLAGSDSGLISKSSR